MSDNSANPQKILVLMPFAKSFDDIYFMGIKAACQSLGLICERVDEQVFDESILKHVYDQIASAHLIIVDMTHKNPNVFYELGYAHALGKRVILLTQETEEVPFDLKHYPHIVYGSSIRTLFDELSRKLKWFITQPSPEQSSPMSWGLRGIYRTRAEMNQTSNKYLLANRKRLDVIAFGLRSFRDALSDLLENKVANGMSLRLLVPNPESPFVSQREKEELEVQGQIRNSILSLSAWITRLKRTAASNEQVSLRYYDAMPLNFFFRLDDALYVGPYLYGKLSQQTISFEFSAGSAGYEYYCRYFDSLWSDTDFCRDYLDLTSQPKDQGAK